jgi:hypothetical protein
MGIKNNLSDTNINSNEQNVTLDKKSNSNILLVIGLKMTVQHCQY